MKKIIIALIVLVLIGLGIYFFINAKGKEVLVDKVSVTPSKTSSTTAPSKPVDSSKTILGTSVENRNIIAYHYGTGKKEVLFVGGIHGGYEWNTALLAHELMDYLAANPTSIPSGLKVTVIPVLNPDGLYKVVGTSDRFTKADVSTKKETVIAGRFNANNVDLNRNFDCNWKAKGVWQNETVSGGVSSFSEPESQAFKKYVESKNPTAVVAWYSSAGGVFSSSCNNGVLPETKKITDLYATASKYPASESYDFYKLTGDMVNWLAKKNIPAISVLLTTHQDTEWTKNLAGVKAVLAHYAK